MRSRDLYYSQFETGSEILSFFYLGDFNLPLFPLHRNLYSSVLFITRSDLINSFTHSPTSNTRYVTYILSINGTAIDSACSFALRASDHRSR